MEYVWLAVGFLLLIKGADFFVDSSSTIARKLSVSPIIVGLTIVAFGTSAPEAVVSIIAAMEGNGDMVIGNIVGSNIINITLLLGVTVLIAPLMMDRSTVHKDIPFGLSASVIMLILMSDTLLFGGDWNAIGRIDGLIILVIFAGFISSIFMKAMRGRDATLDKEAAETGVEGNDTWPKLIVLSVAGIAGIVIGGNLVVNSATEIALALGMSQALVGLTIVAVGTALPELTTSVTAAVKGEPSIAVGNLIGSNIFNVLLVTGLSSVVAPLEVGGELFIDMWIMIGITLLVFVLARTGFKLGRFEGTVLIVTYAVYLVYILMRG